jgi:hypothetical protein
MKQWPQNEDADREMAEWLSSQLNNAKAIELALKMARNAGVKKAGRIIGKKAPL